MPDLKPEKDERGCTGSPGAAAGLPVLHVPCISPSSSYDPRQLAAEMAKVIGV